MSGFYGTSKHSLDDKKRLIVPKRFLDVIKPQLDAEQPYVLTAGFEGNLLLLSKAAFDRMVEALGADLLVDRKRSLARRLAIGHAEFIKVDGAGRMVIPEPLQAVAGITGDVVLSGLGDVIEIWARDRWPDVTVVRGALFEETHPFEPAASTGA
jgi:MraZ protein